MSNETPITDDTLLRLADAAERAFPGGGMTVSGLRREAARGRLEIFRIAGKDYTTLAAIREMRRLCRVAPKIPAPVDEGQASRQLRLKIDRLQGEYRAGKVR